MPYVDDAARTRLDGFVTEIPDIYVPGELSYLVTMLALKYLADQGTRYTTVNDVLGALEGAKLEFYRRVAAPYEETKRAQNGDVY